MDIKDPYKYMFLKQQSFMRNIIFYNNEIYKIDYNDKLAYGDNNIIFNYSYLVIASGLESEYTLHSNKSNKINLDLNDDFIDNNNNNNNLDRNIENYILNEKVPLIDLFDIYYNTFKQRYYFDSFIRNNIEKSSITFSNFVKSKKGNIVYFFGEKDYLSVIKALNHTISLLLNIDNNMRISNKKSKINFIKLFKFYNNKLSELYDNNDYIVKNNIYFNNKYNEINLIICLPFSKNELIFNKDDTNNILKYIIKDKLKTINGFLNSDNVSLI